jgi:hypothetical protein
MWQIQNPVKKCPSDGPKITKRVFLKKNSSNNRINLIAFMNTLFLAKTT